VITGPVLGSGPIILLAPPSPPGAPHLGTLYTWSLLDALRRAALHLGGTAFLPGSWNMSSRRLESAFASCEEVDTYRQSALAFAHAKLNDFGIHTSSDITLRDDDPVVCRHVQETILCLADNGQICYSTANEKWCSRCELSLPPTSGTADCFQCHRPLSHRTSTDWFLSLDHARIKQKADLARWAPAYARRRFDDLDRIHPLLRIAHPRRMLGVPSPLRSDNVIDPRLTGALWPTILRRLGYHAPLVTVSGFDIQRKWLMTLFAANSEPAAPAVVVNHGTLLDGNGRKMSRYSGASLADLPEKVEPCIIRAALLFTPLGKDLRCTDLPVAAASRLREKTLNCLRYLKFHATTCAAGVNLDLELGESLQQVDERLRVFDLPGALQAYRQAVLNDLSSRCIPQIRRDGLARHSSAVRNIMTLHHVFFGDDQRLEQQRIQA
jgi:hypothetical protein